MKVPDTVTRRSLLKAGLAGLTCSLLPSFASALAVTPQARLLSFYNTHTGETLKRVYWEKGVYIAQSLHDINYVLRDHRTNAVKPIDPRLLDVIYLVHAKLESSEPFEVISGYRSPQSNMQLYEHNNGVAFKSLHMEGKAIDVRLGDRSLKSLRSEAMQLQCGGVGYYPTSDFVHIDTGAIRYW